MAVTAAEVEGLLVLQVGDTPDGRLGAYVDVLWQQYAQQGAIYPPLQRGLVRRDLIDLALGYYRGQVDTTLGETAMRYSQRVAALSAMRTDAERDLALLWQRARASRAGLVQPIAQVEPVLPPDQRPPAPATDEADAFDESYQGSPYVGQGRQIG